MHNAYMLRYHLLFKIQLENQLMKKHGIGIKMLLVKEDVQLWTHGGKQVCQYVFIIFITRS